MTDVQQNSNNSGKDEEKTMTVEEFETYCCSGGNARPYNQDRNKSITERFIFDELPELEFAKDTVGNCVRDAMKALKFPILHQINSNCQATDSTRPQNFPAGEKSTLSDGIPGTCSSNPSTSEVAICGIDLMLEIIESDFIAENGELFQSSKPQFNAFILEVNNNPAMAANGKLMSLKYRDHLIQFVKHTLLLGLDESTPCNHNFEYLW